MTEKKQSTERRSKSNARKSGTHTDTMSETIPAVVQERTQNRYYAAAERRRCYGERMDRKRKSEQAIQETFIWGVGPKQALY